MSDQNAASFAFISLDRLATNAYNARRFTENMTPQRQARFLELTASIREKGVIEPLLVRPLGKNRFEIIAGERRYRAACVAAGEIGKDQWEYEVPCMVREVSEDDAFDLMLIENLQRDDLTPFETAQAFRTFLERHGNGGGAMADLALRTGIPAHAIRRQVRLLELPAEVLAAWNEGKITPSHAELFTRLDDAGQVLELLAACVRLKLSTRELAERIGTISPDLDRAFFDKTDCQICHHNSAVQSGLFADVAQAGKCGNGGCFEAKQGAFFTDHWLESKAAEAYGTRGFRFGHRLGADRCEMIMVDPAARCRECDGFITLLRLNGTVVSGYAASCSGPAACYAELYRDRDTVPEVVGTPAAPAPVNSGDKEDVQDVEKPVVNTPSSLPPETPPAAPASQKPAAAPPKEETGPVYNAQRGEKAREAFLRVTLPERIKATDPGDNNNLRLALLSLALVSAAAQACLTARFGLSERCKPEVLAEKIFTGIADKDVLEELQTVSLAQLLDFRTAPAVRRNVAAKFGIDMAWEWRIDRDYLEALTKSEIVRIGEEPRVDLWKDEQVQAYRKEHHQGKALHALKREELIDMILKSGVDLAGRVPDEVAGKS